MASKNGLRSYATPVAFRAALESRLRKGTFGAGFQRKRQIFVFGRLIARLVRTFGDRLVLKGGLALELRLERARTTRDIDLAVFGQVNRMLETLQEAGQMDLKDFLSFEVTQDGEIDGEGVIYGGHHFKVHCKLGGETYLHFPVDVVFGGVMLGSATEVQYRDDLSFIGIPPTIVKLLPISSHIAEKLHAYTLPRRTINFRVRDLPDIALLATVKEPIARPTLYEAISLTFAARETHAVPLSLQSPPQSWGDEYAKLAEENELQWESLADVYAAVKSFIEPVLIDQSPGWWNVAKWTWDPEP